MTSNLGEIVLKVGDVTRRVVNLHRCNFRYYIKALVQAVARHSQFQYWMFMLIHFVYTSVVPRFE